MNLQKSIKYLEGHYLDDPQALFPLILILNSLNSCSLSEVNLLKSKISSLISKEVGKYKTFNYWFRSSSFYSNEAYPDDLDDTFCAWTALFYNNIKVVDKEILLNLSKILLLSQKNNSGPYFTWVVDYKNSPKWKDLDLVVNLNIARFLFSQNISTPGLNKFINERIKSKNLSSVFYNGELPSLYFLSYFYNSDGLLKKEIKEKIIFYLNQNIKDSSIILLLIAIIRFGFKDLLLKVDFEKVLLLQKKDGSIAPFNFYKYKNKKTGKKYYSNDALSTALFLELLCLMNNLELDNRKLFLKKKLSNLFKSRIIFLKDARSEKLLLEKANLVINSKQSDFALFFPQKFIFSLKKKIELNCDLLLSLSLVNLLAWISYTIYDHINDDEGDSDKLSLANLSFQILIKEMLLFPDSSKYLRKIINYFIQMEKNSLKEMDNYRFNANPWIKISEITDLDVEDFSYKKSIGQIFSIDFLLGYFKLKDKKIILEIMRYLILVKQMNDDAHDCFEDLKNGQINSVNYTLLKFISLDKKRDLFFKNDMKELRLIYHKEIIPVFSKKMLFYIEKARILLKKQELLIENNFLEKIFSDYEIIIKKGLRERLNLISYSK